MSHILSLSAVLSYVDGSETKASVAVDDLKDDPYFEDQSAFYDSIPYFASLFADIGAGVDIPALPGSGLEIRKVIPKIFFRYTVGEETFELSAFRDNNNILVVNGNGSWEHFDKSFAAEAAAFLDRVWPGTVVGDTFSVAQAVAGDTSIVFDWNTTQANDILFSQFKVTDVGSSSAPLQSVIFPEGTKTIYLIGTLAASGGNTIGGAEIEVLNTDGVLSFTLIRQIYDSGTDYLVPSWDDLSQSNSNVGVFTQAMGDLIFSAS